MTILIKGMEMPRSCDYCPFLVRKKGFVPYCGITADLDLRSFDNDGRLRNCPLVEVPTPHGRLKDADAFDSIKYEIPTTLPQRYEQGFHDGVNYVQHLIMDAPTVIEAEE